MIASALFCLAVAITDGDTIKVLCDKQVLKVRLAEIDAPERKQPYGTKAKQALAEMCFKRPAQLDIQGIDKYGRNIAIVYCDGKNANREMVRTGMAWMYDRYATQRDWYADQKSAQTQRLGLWRDPSPTPPWEWRKSKKSYPSKRTP